jgi:hypothetical protein
MESLLSAMQSLIGSPGASRSTVNVLQPLQPLPSINGESSSSTTSCSNANLLTPTSTNLAFSETSTFTTDSVPTLSPNPNPFFPSHHYSLSLFAASSNEADEQLNFFRSRMLPSFPFINFTPYMTSLYLRENRPFLFQAIRAVTTFSTQERLIQVEELKRLLFTSALLKVESNIDLLLGLLTYLAWSTDAFLGRADLISRLMMLAISLIYDLRLFKPSSPDVQVMMAITAHADSHDSSESPTDETPYGLLERQRAVLACFILSSKCV